MSAVGAICDRLRRDANALAVMLTDLDGRTLASIGEVSRFDRVSLYPELGSTDAVSNAIGRLLTQGEQATALPTTDGATIHLSMVNRAAILSVLFDDTSSLGLVRLRVREASEALARWFEGPEPDDGSNVLN
jgi:hypothetical protein